MGRPTQPTSFLALAVALLIGLCVATPASGATRVALVIGNSAYRHVPVLPNTLNDAGDVVDSLARLGFSVQRVQDGGFDAMRRALLEFSRKARDADMALVFFAGHGMEVGGENWLIPVDAELKTDLDTEQEAISLKAVMLTVSAASRLGLVVLDACRNNPFAARMQRTLRTRAVDRGFVRVEPTGSVLVAFAARDGTTAADGTGRNSPFTAALLRHLETPGLEINFLFRNVRDDVIAATRRQQEPFVYGSLSKETIYLKSPVPAAAVALPPVAPAPDEVTWNFLKDTTDAAAIGRFIERYPQSPLRPEAEERLRSLSARLPAEKPAPEVQVDRREIARSLQLELKRVGCFDGRVDGEFGGSTRAALRNFAKLAAVSVPDNEPSLDALKALRGIDRRICPLICPAGERAEADRCIRIVCPAGQVLRDGTCVARPSAEAGKRGSTAEPKATPRAPSNARCFSFQGRQFCE
jgi:Caspase domain